MFISNFFYCPALKGVLCLPCVCKCVCVCVLVFPESCPTHNFVLHGEISKLFGTNDYHGKTICRVQEPWHYLA